MCADLGAAKRNRERQHKNLNWWLWYEAFIKTYPRNKLLPGWAVGELPTIDKSERGNMRQYNIYEIGDDGLLKGVDYED